MQCEEWADANSELFKEAHDEAVHKNSYKSRLYELISASLKKGCEKYRNDTAATPPHCHFDRGAVEKSHILMAQAAW